MMGPREFWRQTDKPIIATLTLELVAFGWLMILYGFIPVFLPLLVLSAREFAVGFIEARRKRLGIVPTALQRRAAWAKENGGAGGHRQV